MGETPQKCVAIEAKEPPGKRSQALSFSKIQAGLGMSAQPVGWPGSRSFQGASWRLGFVSWPNAHWPHSDESESYGSADATSLKSVKFL